MLAGTIRTMTMPPVASAPPGWYRTGYGDVRWWDGYAWTVAAPRGSDDSDHGWAVLAHLGIFLLGILVPALIRYAKPQPSAFLRRHSVEALNFQITVFGVSILLTPVFLIVMLLSWDDFFSAAGAEQFAFPVWSVALWVLWVTYGFCVGAFAIMAAVRAGQDRPWRYPITIRWVRDDDRD